MVQMLGVRGAGLGVKCERCQGKGLRVRNLETGVQGSGSDIMGQASGVMKQDTCPQLALWGFIV